MKNNMKKFYKKKNLSIIYHLDDKKSDKKSK